LFRVLSFDIFYVEVCLSDILAFLIRPPTSSSPLGMRVQCLLVTCMCIVKLGYNKEAVIVWKINIYKCMGATRRSRRK
jgi:hypothetical protein